jgi:adenylate cyclase
LKKQAHPIIDAFRQWLKIAVFCLLPAATIAQGAGVVDSLRQLLGQAPPDTARVNLLTGLSWELKFDNPAEARVHLDSALLLARRLNFEKGEATTLNFRGVVEDIHGKSDLAVQFFQQALDLRQKLGDRKGVASLFNNIGNVRENQGDYLAALDNYQRSLRIREDLKDTARITRAFYNIAILQENMGNYPEALDYIFQHLEYSESTASEDGIANAWNIIGNIKTETDRHDEALAAYDKSLAIQRKSGDDWKISSVLNNIANLKDAIAEDAMDDGNLGDTVLALFNEAIALHREALGIRQKLEDASGQAESFNNIGYVLKNLGSFYDESKRPKQAAATWKDAEKYLRRSLAIRETEGDKAGIMEVYNGIADVRRRQKRYKEALAYTQRYYAIAVEIGDQKFQQNGLKDLARIYNKMGEYKLAYKYRKEYDELRYNRFSEERLKSEERREIVYGDRKKQGEIDRQQNELRIRDAQLKTASAIQYSLIGGALLLLLLAGVMLNRNKVIRREKQRSENLLLNILPAQTADELKKYGKAKARRYDSVTVLFTDFQSFTQIAERTSPEALVAELDECFRAFDEIATRFNIEKIKTIGDAYFGVAGLPTPTHTHAEDAVSAALAMQAFMEQFRVKQKREGKPEFFCRIGIHSGPVVSGVVGKKKFAYDIWGDTVNLAARMEQSGKVNQVNISQSTRDLLGPQFHCIHRGKVKAKNKGVLDMYFVETEIGKMPEKKFEGTP